MASKHNMTKKLKAAEQTYLNQKARAREVHKNIVGSLEVQEIYNKIMGFTDEDYYGETFKDFAQNDF